MTKIFLSFLLMAPAVEAKPDRERIESIEINAAGVAGVIHTSPEFMRGSEREYHFGSGACKSHTLGDRTLEQLVAAMRAGHFVKITADRRGAKAPVDCVASVRFFAPDP